MRFIYLLLAGLVVFPVYGHAQSCHTDVKYVNNKEELRRMIKEDPTRNFIELKKIIPNLTLDIRYATANNFTHSILYYHPLVCLRSEPAYALQKIQADLNRRGLALKVFDAFRPFSVTCHMWHLVRDKRYVANPREGSNHNRGTAVDLTIIDMKTGQELDMGTGYDNFTDTAHQSFTQLPPQVLANRKLLRSVMHKYGFGVFETEWWHYQWRAAHDYEVVDLDFPDLKAAIAP